MIVPYITLAQMLHEAGFPPGKSQQIGCAIVAAESGRDTAAKYVNSDEWHSVDRGLWEINDHWHPEVSDECAYDAVCSTKEAFRISDGGTDYSPWSTFTNGRYEAHMEAAAVALAGAAQVRTLKVQVARLTAERDDLANSNTKLLNKIAVVRADIVVVRDKVQETLAALNA